MQGPSTHFNPQKAPSLSSSGEVVVAGGCCTRLLEVGGMGNTKEEGNWFKEMCERSWGKKPLLTETILFDFDGVLRKNECK